MRVIYDNLSRLRACERRLQLTWNAARALGVALTVLAVACLLDYLVDRQRETPWVLRWAMLVGQAALWVAAAGFIVVPLLRRVSDSWLALWVEEKAATLGHRLISAVQLNAPGARTEGMSPALIAAVTREAEEQAGHIDFADLADRRRLKWSAWLLTPFALALVVLLVLRPGVVFALLARQFLAEQEIPRSVVLEDVSRPVWPSGEEVLLAFRVTGDGVTEELTGEVRIEPDGRPRERYALAFASRDESGSAVFTARVPTAVADFQYHAWLKDGRTRQPGRIRLEARPVVQQLDAWVRLPASCGLRLHLLDVLPAPAGLPRLPMSLLAAEPFEEYQKGGDLVQRLPGSTARVAVGVQKPVAEAVLELLGSMTSGQDPVRRQIPMTLGADGQSAETVFQARLDEAAYRILVRDRHGFENRDRPRRVVRTEPADPPQVALLPEYFSRIDRGFSEEYEVEGIPLLLGERIRISYRCASPYGLSQAQLRYRVYTEEELQRLGEDGVRRLERRWEMLPLPEARGTFESGPFDPRRGVFANSGRETQVFFYMIPADDFDTLGGTTGGGRFDFQTRTLTVAADRPEFPVLFLGAQPADAGMAMAWTMHEVSQRTLPAPMRSLAVGDRIEFFIEVFDRNPDPDHPPGRSERRWKVVVTEQRLLEWIVQKDDQKQRIRELEEKQRDVYGKGEMDKKERR